jgi:hypothetical protein
MDQKPLLHRGRRHDHPGLCEKLRGLLVFYVGAMSIVGAILGLACATSFIFAWRIRQIYGVRGDGKTGEVACQSGLYGCCCCDIEDVEDDELCPEWSREEIIHIIEADFKIAGLTAAISCLFVVRAIRSCSLLLANLKNYKCTYL